ncbi:ATP-binding cassette domain-containing protein, partial [Candidatus Parcubacteria bacterium]|nr:ATP-binding cassette domain-containing protein [Candidatus Parcubacteria bacterium]
MQPLIKAKNLNFVYNKGKDNEFQALININLEIYPEEYIIFFGPSGCGKSTLLNVISGLETPDEGIIIVAEKDLTKMNAKEFAQYHREKIGMIFQAYNLINSLSVLDNVALPQVFL